MRRDAAALQQPDAVMILTNHSAYDPRFIVDNAKLVFDTRYLTGISKAIIWKA